MDYFRDIDRFESMSFEERRSAVKNLNMDEKFHTKKTLKEVFRVKPKHDAISSYSYKDCYKNEIQCYTLSQCIPMRPLSTKPRTKAQKEATKKMLLSTPKGKAISWCKKAVENGIVVIDTETTGLDGYVIQIAAVCCKTGDVLYESLVATEHNISEEATKIHGITYAMLEYAPKIDVVSGELEAALGGREWTAFNIDFDEFAIRRTFGDSLIKTMSDKCAMRIAATVFGSTNRYGSISLNDAMNHAAVKRVGFAHDAASDAIGTVEVIRAIAKLL